MDLFGKSEQVKYLVEQDNVNLNAAGMDGNTAITFAVQESKDDLVYYFLDQGCDFKSANDTGRTPLLMTCQGGKETCARAFKLWCRSQKTKQIKGCLLGLQLWSTHEYLVEGHGRYNILV